MRAMVMHVYLGKKMDRWTNHDPWSAIGVRASSSSPMSTALTQAVCTVCCGIELVTGGNQVLKSNGWHQKKPHSKPGTQIGFEQ